LFAALFIGGNVSMTSSRTVRDFSHRMVKISHRTVNLMWSMQNINKNLRFSLCGIPPMTTWCWICKTKYKSLSLTLGTDTLYSVIFVFIYTVIVSQFFKYKIMQLIKNLVVQVPAWIRPGHLVPPSSWTIQVNFNPQNSMPYARGFNVCSLGS
jgi:hypothetical protein